MSIINNTYQINIPGSYMFEEYQSTLIGLWIILTTILFQAMVAIRYHRSQKGGYKVGIIKPELGQSSIVFRSHRTFHNSLENIIPFFGMVVLGVLSEYSASKLAIVTWIYATTRIIHMVLYYKIVTEKNPSPRSLFWAIGFITNIYLLVDLGIHLIIKL